MWFCCGGRRPTRFQSLAEPTLKRLQSTHEALKGKGQTYAAIALAKKREAAEHYRRGDNYMARATAMEAVTHDDMAGRYLHMVEAVQVMVRKVHQLWASHDKLDSAATTADDLRQLGVVQKDELTGTEEVPSFEARIEAANKMVDDFSRLVAETDNEIKKVSTGDGENADDLLDLVQRWGLGQLLGSPQRDLTPDQLEMNAD